VLSSWRPCVATTNQQAAIAIVREANPHALSVEIAERPLQPGDGQAVRAATGRGAGAVK
jgi:hypothetical protein